MADLIDLSIPVRHGEGRLGTTVAFDRPYRFDNVGWQGATFSMFCHYATHIDAPNHFIRGGRAIDQVPLEGLMGAAALIELSDHEEESAITGDTLEARGAHVCRDDIAILRTTWSDRRWGTDAFWKSGPYLDPNGADWLVERGVKAVVYDFAEEYVVRTGDFRGEDCVVHHKILGRDIYNIEYVHNLGKITRPRLTLIALPLKLAGLDGAPARVVALEGADLPAHLQPR